MTTEFAGSTASEAGARGGSLRSSIHRVAGASALALLVAELVSFGQTIALARILSPTEVGVFVAGTVLTTFLGNFVEGGMRSALIQRAENVADAAETVFWVTLIGGAVMAVGALAVAPVVGRVFGDETVALVAAVTSGLLLIHGLTNVPEALLQRAFSVKRRLVVGPLVSVTFAAVSVSLALAGWGVWSMVAGQYAAQTAGLLALWAIARYRPGRGGRASVAMWRELARYGFPLVLGLVGARARTLAEALVVGRGLSTGALGSFRYAQRIARIPTSAFIEIGSNALFPAFSRICREPDRLRAAYVRALHWAMVPAAAVAGVLFALGEPAVVVLFGEPWRPAGLAVVAMSGLSIGYALTCVSEEVIKGSGRTRLLNWLTGADLVLGVGLLVGFVAWAGLLGAALSLSVASTVIGLGMLVLARRVVVVPVGQLVVALGSPLPGVVVATGLTWLLEHQVVQSATRPVPLGIVALGGEVLIYTVVYVCVLAVFARSSALAILRAGSRPLTLWRRRDG